MIVDTDEILVKGIDGKWYLLRGEELVPYESGLEASSQKLGARELPKGVTHEVHQKLEQKTVPRVQAPIAPMAPSRPVVVSHEGHPLVKELEELIDQAVAESQKVIQAQIPPWDAVLQKRFRVLVSARLRDVRDALETKGLLARDIKIGGMGLKEADTQSLSVIIEAKFKEFDQKWRAEETKKRVEWQKKQAGEAAQRERERLQREEEDMEKRHQVLIGRSGTIEKISSVMSRPASQEQAKITNYSAKGGSASGGQLPITNKISNSKVVESKTVKSSVVTPGFRRDSRSPAERQAAALPPLPAVTRPKVVDVKFTPRLLSPIEELREMNLIDFRRSGRDASEIIFKIKAKIDLLSDESFAKKMEGVAAWKQSEPAKLYTVLSSVALTSGQSVSIIIAEREKKGEKTLTVDEFSGIMELMKNLRF